MEPTREVNATLVDLLDRVLDKGLLINADIIITVAEIPLIGVNLKAAIAGMETMLEYGMMRDWDLAQRTIAREERKQIKPILMEDEKIIAEAFASCYYKEGIYKAWRTGQLYITNKRIVLFRKEPYEILFETDFENIKILRTKKRANTLDLHIYLKDNTLVELHAKDIKELKRLVQSKIMPIVV